MRRIWFRLWLWNLDLRRNLIPCWAQKVLSRPLKEFRMLLIQVLPLLRQTVTILGRWITKQSAISANLKKTFKETFTKRIAEGSHILRWARNWANRFTTPSLKFKAQNQLKWAALISLDRRQHVQGWNGFKLKEVSLRTRLGNGLKLFSWWCSQAANGLASKLWMNFVIVLAWESLHALNSWEEKNRHRRKVG